MMTFGVPPTINCNSKCESFMIFEQSIIQVSYKHEAQLAKKVYIYANILAMKSIRDVGHMM